MKLTMISSCLIYHRSSFWVDLQLAVFQRIIHTAENYYEAVIVCFLLDILCGEDGFQQ